METEIHHHQFEADLIDDDYGVTVILTQDNPDGDEPHLIALHPSQLRMVCAQFGLITASDAQAAKTIATQQRRMLVLVTRIAHLANQLAATNADIAHAAGYAAATADIAAEFIADFTTDADAAPAQQPQAAKPTATEAPATQSLFN